MRGYFGQIIRTILMDITAEGSVNVFLCLINICSTTVSILNEMCCSMAEIRQNVERKTRKVDITST